MDLNDCFKKKLIIKVKVDKNKVISLLEVSKIKENAVKDVKLNEENITAYVSFAYDSLRETLEALCVSLGYKVISHLCVGELLKGVIEEFDYNLFDRVRYIRNGINYYGSKIEFEQGRDLIKKIFEMKHKIIEKYFKGFC
ncbi:MAG: hypothetical protein KKG60_02065 [Nanoarchaeota archaeon]|nr:hypothetical protein [Nanoarchaeota archaeon]